MASHQKAIAGLLSTYRSTKNALVNHPYNTGLDTGEKSKNEFELLLSRLTPVSALEKTLADFAVVIARGNSGHAAVKIFSIIKQDGLALLCGSDVVNCIIVGTRHTRFHIVEESGKYVTQPGRQISGQRHSSTGPRAAAIKKKRPKKGLEHDELADLFGQLVDHNPETEQVKLPEPVPIVEPKPTVESNYAGAVIDPQNVQPIKNQPQQAAQHTYASAAQGPRTVSWADIENE